MQEGYKTHEDMFSEAQKKYVISMLAKPLDYFGYFKTSKYENKYAKFDRPTYLGESTDSELGPKYQISNVATIADNAKASQKERAQWLHEIKGHPMKAKYNTTDLAYTFTTGYTKIKDPYFPKKKDQ